MTKLFSYPECEELDDIEDKILDVDGMSRKELENMLLSLKVNDWIRTLHGIDLIEDHDYYEEIITSAIAKSSHANKAYKRIMNGFKNSSEKTRNCYDRPFPNPYPIEF
jgi:hypothetical protein